MTITKTKNLVNRIVTLQAELAPLEAELAEAKTELLEQMTADGVDRTDKFHGAYATIVERTNYTVVNELELKAWMREKRLTAANFMKFDTPKVRQVGEVLNVTVPGTATSVTPYVKIVQSGLTKLTQVK
jgi:hypothetical protein